MLKFILITIITLSAPTFAFAQSRGIPDRETEGGASKAEECVSGRCAKNEDAYSRHMSRAEVVELVRRLTTDPQGTPPPEIATKDSKGTR